MQNDKRVTELAMTSIWRDFIEKLQIEIEDGPELCWVKTIE